MTTRLATNVIPFPSAAHRQVGAAIVDIRAHTLREARRKIAETWELKAESRAVQRRILERQGRIEKLLQGIEADVERA